MNFYSPSRLLCSGLLPARLLPSGRLKRFLSPTVWCSLVVAAALASLPAAQAQTAASVSAPARPALPASSSKAASAPRYSASDAKLAFGLLDADGDGKISREEAARAKNVAKYFDRADVNQDKGLSLQEFTAALNKAKVL